ncbi:MAG: succinylglutamate desuccinylase/aspartoacylase family protein [Planctomycetota bacterium]|jgi:predicted deacylase
MLESIGEVQMSSGEVVHGSLDFEGMKIPVALAAGASDGPALLVTCLQHATEFSGPGALDRALEVLDLSKLRGVLVGMPAVNPIQVEYAFEQHSAAHKKPETNLNRQWPGEAGSDNQFSRLAALLWTEAVGKCDALIDFHCCRKVDPRFAAAAEGHEPSEKLASAVGLEAVDLQTAESYARGLLFVHAATDLDVASILVESHPGGFQVREAVDTCAGVIFRAMTHLGMLDELPVPPAPREGAAPVFRRAEKAAQLRNEKPGYLAVRRWAGERVAKGEAVAVVRSLETFEVVEELVSPLDGAVACVGDPAGAGLVAAGVVAATVKSAR